MSAVKKSKKKSARKAAGKKGVKKKTRGKIKVSKKKASKKSASNKKRTTKPTAGKKARGKKVVGKKSGKIHKVPVAEPRHQYELFETPFAGRMATAHKPNFDERDSKLSPQRKASGPEKKRRRTASKATGRMMSGATPHVAPTTITLNKSK